MKKLIVPIVKFAATCLLAHGAWAAQWTGANSDILDDPLNWDGDIATSAMLFGKDASTVITNDVTVYGVYKDEESGNSYKGRTVEFDLDGHMLTSQNAGYWRLNNTTYRFTGGGSISFVSGSTTNTITVDNANNPRCFIDVSGSGTTFVGNYFSRAKQTSGFGARFRVLDGAVAQGNFHFAGRYSTNEVSNGGAIYFGKGSNDFGPALSVGGNDSYPNHYNNVLRVSGGTVASRVSGNGSNRGSIGIGHGTSSYGNWLIVQNGGTASASSYILVGPGKSHDNTLLATGAGSTVSAWHVYLGTADDAEERNNAIVVADGSRMNVSSTFHFRGKGNILSISNATVNIAYHLDPSAGTTNTIRFAGANPVLSCKDIVENVNSLKGSPILEYVIPEAGWATAPLRTTTAFSIPADVTLRIDEVSVKAYLKANPHGGVVPLMTTQSASRAITIADMDALSANLPNGCSLENESGVLSLKIKSSLGFMVIVF